MGALPAPAVLSSTRTGKVAISPMDHTEKYMYTEKSLESGQICPPMRVKQITNFQHQGASPLTLLRP